MLHGEGVLLGRLKENSDPTHPSFVPNMEDHLMYAVNENPISKFNFLAKHLSEFIEKDLKEYNKDYHKTLKTYFKK